MRDSFEFDSTKKKNPNLSNLDKAGKLQRSNHQNRGEDQGQQEIKE